MSGSTGSMFQNFAIKIIFYVFFFGYFNLRILDPVPIGYVSQVGDVRTHCTPIFWS